MSNPDTEVNEDIVNTYREKVRKLKYNITEYDKDGNYNTLLTDIKNDMLSLGYDEKYICDVLVKQLFGITKSINKRAFWSIYGDIVYNNLCRNIDENFIQCDKCKTRFYVRKVGQTVCDKCLEKEKQRQERLQKEHKKIVVCCDCGGEFEASIFATNQIRCSQCQNKINKINNLKRVKRCLNKKY